MENNGKDSIYKNKIDIFVFACIVFLLTLAAPILIYSNKDIHLKGETVKSLGTIPSGSEIINATEPKIVFKTSEPIETDTSDVEIVLESNRLLSSDSDDAAITLLDSERFHDYVLIINSIEEGKNIRNIQITDKAGNKLSKELEISRKENSPTNTVPKYENISIAKDGDDLTVVVDKQHRLLQSYVPSDLVSPAQYGITVYGNVQLRKVLIDDLQQMYKDIEADGFDLMISSGYRSYSTQVTTYNYWLNYNQGSVEAADAISARPGHSEHQLGTTMDFVNSETNYQLTKDFGSTKAGRWLAANAYKYGFALSYPQGETEVTGYTYEPWHWRYIGREHALEWNQSGLTLVQFLESINQ